MKSILISIRPEWCSLIVQGKKTLEVRKTRPKIETPFRCYIYCTNKKPFLVWGEVFRWNWDTEFTRLYGYSRKKAEEIWDVFNGRIMGEFICDDIRYADAFNFIVKEDGEKALEGSCIDKADLFEYLGWENGRPRAECTPFYRWHISNLIIYDQPRKIGEFRRICHNDLYCESCAMHYTHNGNCDNYSLQVRRPPQSWCYVEELEENNGR